MKMNATKLFPFKPQKCHFPVLFPLAEWKLSSNVWISNAPQGSKEWLMARQGRIPVHLLNRRSHLEYVCARVTVSNFAAAAGRSRFSTSAELAQEIAGIKEKCFSEEALERMNHGTREEPNARRWYEKAYHVDVEEIGLVVPTWNFHLGGSVDGIVKGTEGIIEIKCPKKMYRPLKEHIRAREIGWTPRSPYFRSHIWPTHYDQMQGGMAILDKKWCDYIVYATEDGEAHCERILFNEKYWKESLYPKIQSFLSDELFPLIEDQLRDRD